MKRGERWASSRWYFPPEFILSTPYMAEKAKTTLETSGKDVTLHSKRVGKMWNYTRNERRRCKTTIETGGEDVTLHSKRVEKAKTTPETSGEDVKLHSNEWRRCKTTLETSGEDDKTTLETSGEDVKIHSFRVYFFMPTSGPRVVCCINWSQMKIPLYVLLKIRRRWGARAYRRLYGTVGYWMVEFYTRFECSFTSSPLFSSVVSHLLHSFRVYFHIFSNRFECSSHLPHSFRVWFSGQFHPLPSSISFPPRLELLLKGMFNVDFEERYTLEKVKTHSKRVEKMWKHTRN